MLDSYGVVMLDYYWTAMHCRIPFLFSFVTDGYSGYHLKKLIVINRKRKKLFTYTDKHKSHYHKDDETCLETLQMWDWPCDGKSLQQCRKAVTSFEGKIAPRRQCARAGTSLWRATGGKKDPWPLGSLMSSLPYFLTERSHKSSFS